MTEPTPESRKAEVVEAVPPEKQVRVYVDMVADLFHYGHVSFIKKARAFGNYLIVGLSSDEACTGYKRRPVLDLEERARSVLGCRYVDEVVVNCPLRVTKEFMEEYKIDIVAHGDDFDKEKLHYWYGAAIDQDKFRVVPYTKGVSTTELLTRIKDRFALDKPEHEKFLESFNKEANPLGFEAAPFLVGSYNNLVSKSFRLDYPSNTLAVVVISNNKMFDTVKKYYTDNLKDKEPVNGLHPVDKCVSHYISEIAFKVFPACDIIFDFDKASPTAVQPKINIQTAGHVSGIAYYYQRKDVESADDVWPDSNVCGVSVHPVYGGWFAFRAVIVLKALQPKIIHPAFPVDCVKSEEDRIKLLNGFNKNWQNFEWRNIIPVAKDNTYSEEQIQYFHTEYASRNQDVLCYPRST